MHTDPHFTLDLVLSLLRTLSHKIRSPLSVISNDLSYLKTLVDPEECERGILKCRQISDFFKPAQLLMSSADKNETFALTEVLRDVFADRSMILGDETTLTGARCHLIQAFRWIDELLKVKEIGSSGKSYNLSVELFESMFTENLASGLGSNKNQNTGISIWFKGDDSILPVLIDAVLSTFGAYIEVVHPKELVINFSRVTT